MNVALRLWLCSLLTYGCTEAQELPEEPIRVFAAASLSSALPAVVQAFQKEIQGSSVEFNFAASSVLAKQIHHGAAADLFLSANPEWVDFLVEKDCLAEAGRVEFLSNRLVLILPKGSSRLSSVYDLVSPGVRGIALADWTHVPAGIYASQSLAKSGLWSEVQPKCIPSFDVRAALTYVERKDADCGIVYHSDAALSDRVEIVAELPSQPRIRYVAAPLAGSRHQLGERFLRFLTSSEAQVIFKDYGFEPVLNE